MAKATRITIEDIREVVETELDTRDKRFMFLKCLFPEFAYMIQLEGSSRYTSFELVAYFDKQKMLGSLCAALNSTFKRQITFETIKDGGRHI